MSFTLFADTDRLRLELVGLYKVRRRESNLQGKSRRESEKRESNQGKRACVFEHGMKNQRRRRELTGHYTQIRLLNRNEKLSSFGYFFGVDLMSTCSSLATLAHQSHPLPQCLHTRVDMCQPCGVFGLAVQW